MTFQRQSRQAFPTGLLILLGAFVLALFFFIAKSMQKATPEPPHKEMEEQDSLGKTGGDLWPAEWYYAAREYPTFRPDVTAYEQALTQARHQALTRGGPGSLAAPWTVEGPGNIGARVNTIKVHPTDPNTIYIGYAAGGVWKTTDAGASWTPIFDAQSFLSIGDVELDPQNPNIVYVGTGDPNIGGYPFLGDGLWRSPDGGQTWQNIGLGAQRIISKIIVHPSDSLTLYVATMGLPFERNAARGLYKTVNGGQSWQQVLYVSDQTGIIDLQMDASQPSVLYAASWDRIRNNQESTVSGPNAHVWKTVDAGAHWTVLEGGLPSGDLCRIGLSLGAGNPNDALAVVVDTTLQVRGMYRSANGGDDWSQLSLAGIDTSFLGAFGWYFGKIFINPFDANDLFVLGVETWRSLDGGENWFRTTPEWWTYDVHADGHDMAFVNDSTFLLANDGGLYRSTDRGFSWIKIENNPTSQFYRVAFNPFSPDWYFGGMQDNGTAGGNATDVNGWPRIWGGDGFQAIFHPDYPEIFYFETQNGGLTGTTDGGVNYLKASEGIEPSDRRSWDMPWMLSYHSSDVFYAGTYRVYQGYGQVPGWYPISDDLTDGLVFESRFHVITTLDESPLDADLMYVGTSDGNVWRGSTFGQVWTNVTAGLPDRYVSCVKASPTDYGRVFVTHTGYKSNDFSPHIHRSDDGGATWVSIAGDLPTLAINDLLVVPGYQDSILVAATDGGVYATLDGGQHWQRMGTGMPYIPVYDLEINPAQQTIFAGTHARSMMSFPIDSLVHSGDVGIHVPTGISKPTLSVAPNPASEFLTLTLKNLSARQSTALYIVDLSGKQVWQGNYNGRSDAVEKLALDGFAAGVYLVYARTNGKQWGQRKFVVTH